MQSSYQLHIDGKDVDARSGETLAVENPATGEVVTHAAVAGPGDLNAAVRAGAAAFEDGHDDTINTTAKATRPNRISR